jgi:hypothetical protein
MKLRKLWLSIVAVAMIVVPGAAIASPADAAFDCYGYPNWPSIYSIYSTPVATQSCPSGAYATTVTQLCVEIYIPTGGWGWTNWACGTTAQTYGNGCGGYWGYAFRARSDRYDWSTPWAQYSVYSYGGPNPVVYC